MRSFLLSPGWGRGLPLLRQVSPRRVLLLSAACNPLPRPSAAVLSASRLCRGPGSGSKSLLTASSCFRRHAILCCGLPLLCCRPPGSAASLPAPARPRLRRQVTPHRILLLSAACNPLLRPSAAVLSASRLCCGPGGMQSSAAGPPSPPSLRRCRNPPVAVLLLFYSCRIQPVAVSCCCGRLSSGTVPAPCGRSVRTR